MILKILKSFAVVVAIGSVAVTGFFASECLHLRAENKELKLILTSSIMLSEQRNEAVSRCMSSLTSCTRIVTLNNPQIQAGLYGMQVAKVDSHHCSVCDEVISGPTQ